MGTVIFLFSTGLREGFVMKWPSVKCKPIFRVQRNRNCYRWEQRSWHCYNHKLHDLASLYGFIFNDSRMLRRFNAQTYRQGSLWRAG
jgi:hypothetical protein